MTRHTIWNERERVWNDALLAKRDRLAANDRKPDLFTNHDPFDQRGQHEWRHKVERRLSEQRIVRAFCLAIAVFCIVYFGGQEFLR
jgi:hypothetical protein